MLLRQMRQGVVFGLSQSTSQPVHERLAQPHSHARGCVPICACRTDGQSECVHSLRVRRDGVVWVAVLVGRHGQAVPMNGRELGQGISESDCDGIALIDHDLWSWDWSLYVQNVVGLPLTNSMEVSLAVKLALNVSGAVDRFSSNANVAKGAPVGSASTGNNVVELPIMPSMPDISCPILDILWSCMLSVD